MSNRRTVLGVFRDPHAADRCVEMLFERGYAVDDINVLMSDKTRLQHYGERPVAGDTDVDAEGPSMAAEGVGVGGAIGTAVGATIAAIAAIGTTLVIPGLNLIVAGPLAAALAGGGAGAVTGGVIGGLAGLGFTDENAEAYQTALRDGGTVVGVTLREDDDVEEVQRIMNASSGNQVHVR